MADLEKTVRIIFEAIDNMTDPMGDMGNALSGFGATAGDAAEKADGLGDSIETIPAEVALDISLDDNASDGIGDIRQEIDGLPEQGEFTFDVSAGDYGTIFDNFNEELGATKQEIDDFFNANPGQLSQLEAEEWQNAINSDMEQKQESFDLQKKLIDQQLELLKIKSDALESGAALITIDTTGLEPALEDLMMNLCQKLQARASETLSTFLLGIA